MAKHIITINTESIQKTAQHASPHAKRLAL